MKKLIISICIVILLGGAIYGDMKWWHSTEAKRRHQLVPPMPMPMPSDKWWVEWLSSL